MILQKPEVSHLLIDIAECGNNRVDNIWCGKPRTISTKKYTVETSRHLPAQS